MSRSTPFHKQTDASKLAGQVVYPVATGPGLALESGEFIPAQELTLNDYIERKTDEPKKITFDEWIENNEDASAESIWYAALRYGKIS
jgi:hypothetical protein